MLDQSRRRLSQAFDTAQATRFELGETLEYLTNYGITEADALELATLHGRARGLANSIAALEERIGASWRHTVGVDMAEARP